MSKIRIVVSFILLLFPCLLIYVYKQHDVGSAKDMVSVRHENLKARNTSKSDKWIVLTTISKPTDDVIYMAKIPGWRVVVVGDRKTPNNWTNRNCDYLSLTRQKKMGFKITSMIPENSYSRKNIGYLFAIANGAKVIYETDDDNRPLDKLQQFTFSTKTTGLMFNGFKTFNPYRHFGQSSTWPRGYPLGSIGENFSNTYILGEWRSPLIQQGIVNGDPDVDAIFRLSRKLTSKQLNITFSGRSPPAFVPSGIFSPFNAQNTLFRYDAFWALFIPSTTTTRVCDIWRGYWAQRLLWEIGANIGFYPPNAFSKRNPHLYINDFNEEKDLYFKTDRLLELLQRWICNIKYSFFDCVKDLTSLMVNRGYLKNNDADLIRMWINDLKSLNYIPPKRVRLNVTKNGTQILKVNKYINKNVIFKSQEESPPLISQSEDMFFKSRTDQLLEKCPHLDFANISLSPGKHHNRYENILLVINFNNPFYENIEILEILYRLQFPYIVYCGTSIELLKNTTKRLNKQVTFIEIDTHQGYFAQTCLIQAMQMNYRVDGYLFLMDDVMFNPRNLTSLSSSKIWVLPGTPFSESRKTDNFWVNSKYGLRVYQKGLQELNKTDVIAHRNFKRLLKHNTGLNDGFYKGASDILYIPNRYSRQFIFYMTIFTTNKLFLELAFPTVLAGIEKRENWIILNGYYLWGSNRDRPDRYDDFFKGNKVFVHPLKFSNLFSSQKGQVLFCEKIVPLIFSKDSNSARYKTEQTDWLRVKQGFNLICASTY